MSHKNQIDPKQQQTQSLAAVRAPSAGEAALTSEATGLMDWIHKGDYTTRPKNVFFNFADPAQRDAARRAQMNSGAQGIQALGAPNVNLLAMEKQNLDDQWARDTAGQYEQDVSQAGTRAAGELGDVASLENARELGTLGATTSSYNIDQQKIPWWQQLMNNAAKGAGQGAAMAGG